MNLIPLSLNCRVAWSDTTITALFFNALVHLFSSDEQDSICRETSVPIMRLLNIFKLLPRLLNELMATVPFNTIFETVAGEPEEICPAIKGPDGFFRFVRLENGGFAEVLSREEQGILRN